MAGRRAETRPLSGAEERKAGEVMSEINEKNLKKNAGKVGKLITNVA